MLKMTDVYPEATGESHWERARQTFLDQWPLRLHDLSFLSRHVPLSTAEARALGAQMPELGEQFYPIAEDSAIKAGIRCRKAAKLTARGAW